MKRLMIAALLVAGCGMGGDYRDTSVPMESVSQLDIERYEGLWYEIARFPNSFEEGCTGVTAEYQRRQDGTISVITTCREGRLDGNVRVAEGSATVAAPGQLKVKFVEWLPFAGDYWVIDITDTYDRAVIGVPSGAFGWILARTPTISDADLEAALAVFRANGYDTEALIYTKQQGG